MPNSFLTFFHAVAHYSSADILLRVMKCLENWRLGTCLPPPQGSSLLNYNNHGASSLIRFNNQYDPLRDESIEDRQISPEPEDADGNILGELSGQKKTVHGLDPIEENEKEEAKTVDGEPVKMKKNQSIRTDVQVLFICGLIGPLVHRFEKLQIGGTTGYFLVVLVELLCIISSQLEVGATPGLSTFEQIIDFM